MKKIIYLIVPVLVMATACGANSESEGKGVHVTDNRVDTDSAVTLNNKEVVTTDTINSEVSDDKTESVSQKRKKTVYYSAWTEEHEARYQQRKAVLLARQDSLKAVLAKLEAIIVSAKKYRTGDPVTSADSTVVNK